MGRRYLIKILLVVVTAAVFSEVGRMEFVDWDDHRNVYDNPFLNPVTLEGVLHFWRHPYFTSYVPVTRTVWALLAHLARVPPEQSDVPPDMGAPLDASYFHVANLALHLGSVLLVFAILRILVGRDWPAGAGAALFALHPVQVESVVWVTGMKDVLGGFFGLAALWQYLVYAAQTRDEPAARWRRLHYTLALVAFALALLSKHTTVVLPLVAWALDRWVVGRSTRDCTWALAAWAPLALAGAVAAKVTQGATIVGPPMWARLFVAGDALAFYLSKVVLPVGLGPVHGRTPEVVLSHTWGYVTWVAPCAVAAVIWLRQRSWPVIVASAAVFLAYLLPVLGFMPFRYQTYSTVADRYLYLAMLGPALVLAWGLLRTASKPAAAVCVGALATLGVLSAFQTLHWHNSLTLYSRMVAMNPRNAVLHNALGAHLVLRGRGEEAYLHFQAALSLDPDLPDAHYNLGLQMFRRGEPERAVEHYREALRLRPDCPDTHYNLGLALAALGRTEEADSHYREALRLKPWAWEAHEDLALLLQQQGEYAEAEAHHLEAIRIRPDYARAHYNLGRLYEKTGRPEEAQRELAAAQRLGVDLDSAPQETEGPR